MKDFRRIYFSFFLCCFLCLGFFSLPVSASGSATGQQIVDTAMQYLGKVPYVWGGTKIDGSNPGADCSGFICRIYEKFGFNFWSNRTKLRNCGTNLGTDISVAELGDIIWFKGHVAIYAGVSGGKHMIIHETTSCNANNVIYTDISKGGTLKGVIRIPGITNSSGTSAPDYYYATPVNTDGSLAVNDKPAASTSAGVTMLAAISETDHEVCIVYPAQASGNWYKVNYKGIIGYAYGKYLTQVTLDGTYYDNAHPHNTYNLYSNGCKEYTGGQSADYTVSTVAATCTSGGYTKSVCKICGETILSNQTSALGHTNVTLPAVSATCTRTGLTAGTRCTRCNTVTKAQTVIAKKGHTIVTDPAVAATCTTTGYTAGSHCSVCKTILQARTVIPKKGHSLTSWRTASIATVFRAKIQKRKCRTCGTVLTRSVGSPLTPTLKLSAKRITLKKGKSKTIKVSKLANGDYIVSWKSSKASVASVSGKGKIKARKKGSAKITVTLASGKTGIVKVRVR